MREGCEADYDNAPACSYFQHLHTSASAQTGVREREREGASSCLAQFGFGEGARWRDWPPFGCGA